MLSAFCFISLNIDLALTLAMRGEVFAFIRWW